MLVHAEKVCGPDTPKPSQACTIFTRGGNSGGKPCSFPFIYNGVYYYECVNMTNFNGTWCAITTDYDVDFLWGLCDSK